MIRETVVVTCNSVGEAHIAPMGLRERDGLLLLAPFRPSMTLDNLLATRHAVVNLTDDVRVFAGCLTGRRDWPLFAAETIPGRVLDGTLVHHELALERVEEDEQRPRLFCRIVHTRSHRAFAGFNRAQAAVVEAAVLVSRLHMLPVEKISAEIEYLRIAVDKTAGPREREAWGWLMQAIAEWQLAGVGEQGD